MVGLELDINLEDLFKRLFEFLSFINVNEIEVIRDIMKFDYLARQKYKPRKPWWKPTLTKEERSNYYHTLVENSSAIKGLNLDEKDLFKHTLLEPISFDMEKYFTDGKIFQKQKLLFVYFNPIAEKPTLLILNQDVDVTNK